MYFRRTSERKQGIHVSWLTEYKFNSSEFLEFQNESKNYLNIFHYQLEGFLKMKIKNYDSFFKLALLISGDIQSNPGPTYGVCFVLITYNLPLIPSHNEAWKVFKGKGMHFRHLNVNSLLSKIEELRTLAFNTNISVLRITETKLDNTISKEELKIDGYNLLQSDRNRNGGQVACYIKNNMAHNLQSSISENIENIVLDILLLKSKPITVCII